MLKPGTVVANFVFEYDKAWYPNSHGWHAALLVRGDGANVTTGKPSRIIMFDQWTGTAPNLRPVHNWPPHIEKTKEPSNIADALYDLPYSFADEEQAWLVCSYGGNKRVKGRFHDGHEWNQRMEGSVADWWVKLAPKVGICTVQVREMKSGVRRKSAWAATAVCKNE